MLLLARRDSRSPDFATDLSRVGGFALTSLGCLVWPVNVLLAQDQEPPVAATERASKAGLARSILGIDYAPDGSLIALAARGPDSIFLLETRKFEVVGKLDGHLASVFRVKFLPDSKALVSTGDDGTLRVWDLAKREQRLVIDQHEGGVRGLDVTADGTIAYAGESDRNFRGTVKAWNLADGRLVGELKSYRGGVQSLDLTRDNSSFVTASRDRSIRIWDRAGLRELRVFKMGELYAGRVALTPDNGLLVAAMSDFSVRLLNPADGSQLRQIDPKGKFLPAIAVSPDGRVLATSDLDRLHLWCLPEVSRSTSSKGLGGNVAAIAFAPDGRSVVAAGSTGFVTIFDITR